MKRMTALAAASALFAVAPLMSAHATDEPADVPATVSADAKAVGDTVKKDAKVVAEAAKEGAQQVAEAAKEVAHEVAATTKEGAKEVAATAKRGAEKTKAAIKPDRTDKASQSDKPAKSGDPPAE